MSSTSIIPTIQRTISNHITTRSTYLRQRSRCIKNNQQPNEPKQNNNLHKSNKTQSIHPSLDSIQKHDINQAHHPPKPLHYISYLHQTQYHQKIHSSIKSSEAAYQPQKPTIQTIKQEIQPYNKNQSLKWEHYENTTTENTKPSIQLITDREIIDGK